MYIENIKEKRVFGPTSLTADLGPVLILVENGPNFGATQHLSNGAQHGLSKYIFEVTSHREYL